MRNRALEHSFSFNIFFNEYLGNGDKKVRKKIPVLYKLTICNSIKADVWALPRGRLIKSLPGGGSFDLGLEGWVG